MKFLKRAVDETPGENEDEKFFACELVEFRGFFSKLEHSRWLWVLKSRLVHR